MVVPGLTSSFSVSGALLGSGRAAGAVATGFFVAMVLGRFVGMWPIRPRSGQAGQFPSAPGPDRGRSGPSPEIDADPQRPGQRPARRLHRPSRAAVVGPGEVGAEE